MLDYSLKIANFSWNELKPVKSFVPTVLLLSKIIGFYHSTNASQGEPNTDILMHYFSLFKKHKLHLQLQNWFLNKPFVYWLLLCSGIIHYDQS